MKILLVEPFLGGSHAQWALGLKEFSSHHIEVLGMPDTFWKWRMYGAAVTLAEKIKGTTDKYCLILASDMLDLPAFIGLSGYSGKTALYFHESQWLYPWSPKDKDVEKGRDFSYGFLNFRSAIAADAVYFNSQYHMQAFFRSAKKKLRRLPDHRLTDYVKKIESKSQVLYPGLDLDAFNGKKQHTSGEIPTLLWNHRWEYDKYPELFLRSLKHLKAEDLPFQLILLGENQDKKHPVYNKIITLFASNIIHHGYVENRDAYRNLLQRSHILPVSSRQDFFGISTLEAMNAGAYPLLPSRLAFPEHIPPDHPSRSSFFYKEDNELPLMLAELIRKKKWTDYDPKPIQEWIRRYEWKNIIGSYDAAFEAI